MRWQTLPDLEEMWRLDNKDGISPKQSHYPKRGAGKTECCVTADQWLDRNTGWCEPFKVRISSDACKLRRRSELSDFCRGCKGIRTRGGKPAGGTCLS
jgi:hypothetical protein